MNDITYISQSVHSSDWLILKHHTTKIPELTSTPPKLHLALPQLYKKTKINKRNL